MIQWNVSNSQSICQKWQDKSQGPEYLCTVVLWKSRVKPHDFPILSGWGLLYLLRCFIYIPCYTSMNQQGLMPLFGLSLLLTTLEGLFHSCICSSVLFNGDLGLSSSSKSVMSFPLSCVLFCFIFFLSFLMFLLGHFYTSGSNLALNWSAWANIGCLFFFIFSTDVFCPFYRMNFVLSGSASLFLSYQTFSSVALTWLLGL